MNKIKDLKVDQKLHLFFDNDWHFVTVDEVDYQQEIAKVEFGDGDWTMIDDEDEFRVLITNSEVDNVNKPPHYTYGDIEIIDVIEQVTKDYPPHLIRAGKNSWLAQKYGVLEKSWAIDLKQGFDECMRVLKPNGTLIFKWNEEQIKLSEILNVIGHVPLFGNKRSKTHFLVFMKGAGQ